MFRIIFILICIAIFAYSISKAANLNKDTIVMDKLFGG